MGSRREWTYCELPLMGPRNKKEIDRDEAVALRGPGGKHMLHKQDYARRGTRRWHDRIP